MRYDSLRRASILVTMFMVLFAGMAAPAAGAKAKKKPAPKAAPKVINRGIPRYTLTYSLSQRYGRNEFLGKILDLQMSSMVAEPMFSFTDKLQTSGGRGDLQWTLDVTSQPGGGGTAVMRVLSAGREIQKSTYALVTSAALPPHDPRFTGDPISLNFANANLREVLLTFGRLANLKFVIDPDVKGTVNINFQNVPWDDALDAVITGAGYSYTREGKTVHVIK